MDLIGRVFSLPSVIFDFDCSPLRTSLTFNALFVVVVVTADVVVVGVFFSFAVTLVKMLMVVAVLVLGLFSWLIIDSMLSPPPPLFDFFFCSKSVWGGGAYHALFLASFDFG